MKAVPIHKAKANLSKYIAEAKKGKPVYIGSFGKVEVVLMAAPKKSRTRLGVWANNPDIMIPDNFNDPDPEIIEMFENSKIFPGGMV